MVEPAYNLGMNSASSDDILANSERASFLFYQSEVDLYLL